MTHSLHRHGTPASLKGDFVVLRIGNAPRSGPTLRERLQRRFPRLYEYLRTVYRGLGFGGGAKGLGWTSVFHSRDTLRAHLETLKEADTGCSVVVSGLIDDVQACLADLDLRAHTIQYSLGHFGRTERLPSEEVLEITTMCGHHLVSSRLVEKKMKAVADGRISSDEAAVSLGELCLCKIFNCRRAAALMEKHAHRS